MSSQHQQGGSTGPSASGRWQIWADTGGTFTDCLAQDPEGRMRRVKVLSSSALRGTVARRLSPSALLLQASWQVPDGFFEGCRFRRLGSGEEPVPIVAFQGEDLRLELGREPGETLAPGDGFEILSPEEAPVLAARLVTGTPPGRPLPEIAFRLATTRGTNALLERGGARTALVITQGFGDLLEIGDQQRPDLFALAIDKPRPLYDRVVEVQERLAADGSVLTPLNEAALASAAEELRAAGIESAAVAFLHSFRDPVHEARAGEILRRAGLVHVSESAALAPLIKILPRAQTAVVDAYLGPVIGDYLDQVRESIPGGSIHVMTSAGGLVRGASYRPCDSLLSGPAGGVVGAALAGRRSGEERVIAFDVGGTSTDVARFDGDYEYSFEHRVGDARLVAPALAIESVAAGGGSICSFDGRQLKVGPESAGAHPGPACYGAGGPLTLTDVNLLLGRLDPSRFEIPVRLERAERLLEEVCREAGERAEALLAGFVEIADERTADAIRGISVRRGYDPSAYALVSFGGAGGQHACSVADLLGIDTVLVPRDAGLLSAAGLGAAVIERFAHRQISLPLEDAAPRLEGWWAELSAEALSRVEAEAAGAAVQVRRRLLELRYSGQESTLEVEVASEESPEETFRRAYRQLYGYLPEGRSIELDALRVVASTSVPKEEAAGTPAPSRAVPDRRQRAFFDGAWVEVPVFDREGLAPGALLRGPALVTERHSTSVAPPGWEARIDGAGALRLHRVAGDFEEETS